MQLKISAILLIIKKKFEIKETNEKLELMNKEIIAYLVSISNAKVSFSEETMISSFHHNLNDIMRIGEIADNITKYTDSVLEEGLEFSDAVKLEINKKILFVFKLFDLNKNAFFGIISIS